jgi:vancomycin resistance protein YoaR
MGHMSRSDDAGSSGGTPPAEQDGDGAVMTTADREVGWFESFTGPGAQRPVSEDDTSPAGAPAVEGRADTDGTAPDEAPAAGADTDGTATTPVTAGVTSDAEDAEDADSADVAHADAAAVAGHPADAGRAAVGGEPVATEQATDVSDATADDATADDATADDATADDATGTTGVEVAGADPDVTGADGPPEPVPVVRAPVTSVRLPATVRRTVDEPGTDPVDAGSGDPSGTRVDAYVDLDAADPGPWLPPGGDGADDLWDDRAMPPPPDRRSWWRRARRPALVTALVAGLLFGVYAGAAALLSDRVPFNTTIAGVEVGGLSSAAAVSRVGDAVAEEAAEPFAVSVGPATATLDPAAAGIAPDPAATVASVTGFSLAPADMWRHVVGAGRLPVDVSVDDEALAAALSGLAAEVDAPPVEGDVVLAGGVPSAVTPAPGRRLDTAAAAAALREQWLRADPPLELPSVELTPEVGQAAVDAALAEAEQVLAEDVTVVVADRRVVLPPQLVGDGLGYGPDGDGGLRLEGDGAALRQIVLSRDPDAERAPVDATVTLRNGAPEVVPGAPGVVLDEAELAEQVAAAALGDRVAELEASVAEPAFTTEQAEALGIRELVSEFSTPYPSNAARTENLRVATATINGMIVRPGDTFSLNDALGERTTEKGYRAAGVISNGRYSEGVGGGVSQVSTTLYNAAFFAGLEDVEHKPHSFYISRYPEGREATLNWDPRVEMIFRNTTPYGVLIEAYLAGGRVHVRMWSTPYWEVETSTSERSNFREPQTVYDDDPNCEPQAPASGFDVTVTRVLKRDGQEVERESDTWSYSAADRIICAPRPAPDPVEDDAADDG